jgi:hypothetical protein
MLEAVHTQNILLVHDAAAAAAVQTDSSEKAVTKVLDRN